MNGNRFRRYRTVFLLLLEQRTAFSPGGANDSLSWTDMPIDRDGQAPLILGRRVCERRVGKSLCPDSFDQPMR